MNVKDLSLEELKICSLLYSTPNSILRPLEIALIEALGTENLKLEDISLQPNATILEGQWREKPFYTAPQIVIQSLTDKKLLLTREEDNQKFYILNKRKEFKEFFKELEIQIALGSIHYNPE